MDRRSTDKRTIIIVAVLIAALVGLVIWSSTADRIDYSQYNLSAVILTLQSKSLNTVIISVLPVHQ